MNGIGCGGKALWPWECHHDRDGIRRAQGMKAIHEKAVFTMGRMSPVAGMACPRVFRVWGIMNRLCPYPRLLMKSAAKRYRKQCRLRLWFQLEESFMFRDYRIIHEPVPIWNVRKLRRTLEVLLAQGQRGTSAVLATDRSCTLLGSCQYGSVDRARACAFPAAQNCGNEDSVPSVKQRPATRELCRN